MCRISFPQLAALVPPQALNGRDEMATIRMTAAIAGLAALPTLAVAQAPSLAGKNVQMIIGFAAGGTYDPLARLVARHIGKHLPGNPNVVPQNMPGAGSFNAANYIYNVAPKDGTVMGIIAGPAALGPITGAPGARFDPIRITWLGSPTTDSHVCIANNSPHVKVRTVKDLYEKELIVGTSGTGSGIYYFPKALSALLGLKFKIVAGFRSATDVFLAMERGEVEGICQNLTSVSSIRPDWLAGKKVVVLFQGGGAPNPDLKEVPFVNDLARTPEERQAIEFLYAGLGFGRPFIAPPDMPADRAKMVHDAFTATMRDTDFLADAKKENVDVVPINGEYLAA